MTAPEHTVPVWIEDAEGAIVRGTAEAVSTDGARIRLLSPPGFTEGTGVALRVCFDPERPIAAGSARVSWIRSDDGPAECGLEWTQLEAALEEWLAGSGDVEA
mgnify:CR=1 FL=1